jgi:F-box and WD-40 domain protein CDC4
MTWKNLCVKHDYQRRMSEVQHYYSQPTPLASSRSDAFAFGSQGPDSASRGLPSAGLPSAGLATGSMSVDGSARPRLKTYKSHFKQRYLVDAAWRTGGRNITKNITQQAGVVTSLHLTSKYIIVALDNAEIHVFDTEGNALRTLLGHVMGVWAMVPWDDILVSGGCDRDVRVWDLTTG